MTVATLSDVLQKAKEANYAVAGLVVLGWEDARCYTEAAEELNLPVILQAGPGCRANTPVPILGKMFRYLAEQSNSPVVCHLDHGYTKEEMKLAKEPQKILNDNSFAVSATAVRIPTAGGHSESVNVEFENDFKLEDVRDLLNKSRGIIVQDNPETNTYPMPICAHEKDDVFVGRIRKDESTSNGINMWIVADNLRKGAATNTIQIAEYLVKEALI